MAFEDSDIYQAILDGDLAALGWSVGSQDVNLRDSSGKSYLHICIELGQKDLVEYLARKVFLGFRDDNGHTAIDLAARYRMTEVEHQLLRCVASLRDSDDTHTLTQLFQAGWCAWPPLQHHQESEEAPLSPGHRCQLNILNLQPQVKVIHRAVQQGKLSEVRRAVSQELVVVCDHTGLPPLHKAVLFEWLSMVQFLSRAFPHAVNHLDHMGRTALHYAAAYHEYQDNILYKQLIRAGARKDLADLNGFKPTDFLRDPSLFSINHMREEINSRLSRLPKDYSTHVSLEDTDPSGAPLEMDDAKHTIKRWRILTSVASFGNNTHRQTSRRVPFEETWLYESIITNDVYGIRYWLSQGEEVNQHSVEGWSYLHLAVAYNVSPGLLSVLLTHLSPAERDCEGVTPLELAMTTYRNSSLTQVLVEAVVGRMLAGDIPALQALAQRGWHTWPHQDYVDTHLQAHLTPQMSQFLSTVAQFVADVGEVHQAAMLHQTVERGLSSVLDTEAGVTCLNSAGLSLAHVCVIFYNITLLTQILQAFPFTANLKDSVGRTPLHYAACLNDGDYMFTLLRTANARDDVQDLMGQRPVDYFSDSRHMVSPPMQEMIRHKVTHPTVLKPPWPTCLRSALMDSSEVSEAVKTGDLPALQTLLADPSTALTQRDGQGQGFLHLAVLTAADLPTFSLLLTAVDIAARDVHGRTVMDLLVPGLHPPAMREAVEGRVRGLMEGDEGEKEVHRLLMSGWSHWPPDLTADSSAHTPPLMDKLLQMQRQITAVHTAVHEGRTEDLPALLDRPLLVSAADPTGLPPFHKAVIFRHLHMVQYFATDFSSVLHISDHVGRTALHYAAALTDSDMLYRTLVQAGADPTATDMMGYIPKDYQLQPQLLHVDDIIKRITGVNKPAKAFREEEMAEPDKTSSSTVDENARLFQTGTPKAGAVMPAAAPISRSECARAPPPSSEDGKYIAQHLGQALTLALAEIVRKQPADPIEYLGHWLYHYNTVTSGTGHE
ncbi:hypothetical protein ACOMHN_000819 [Nucella lapillus]